MSNASELHKRRSLHVGQFDLNPYNTQTIEDYFEQILNTDTAPSAKEYRQLLDKVDQDFKLKTNLTDVDILFLGLATALQVVRIHIIDKLTKIEIAGEGQLEKNLHNLQEKFFKKYEVGENQLATPYYAPLNQIIDSHGVPYDATRYSDDNLGLFKGGNHRFSTVGHDIVLGLVIGTGNIATNTITCNSGQASTFTLPLMRTYHVNYTQDFSNSISGAAKVYRNPQIGIQASTIIMLNKLVERIQEEPEAVALALVKQIIHIGTDLYTPCGLHLPGLNLITSTKYAEKITKNISSGTVVKAAGSAGTSILINILISMLHKLTYLGTKEELDAKVCEVRTRKIIMLSNAFATTSNLVQTALMQDISKLDIGGALVTAHRIATDTAFIKAVRLEYLNTKTSAIYNEKFKELQDYLDMNG